MTQSILKECIVDGNIVRLPNRQLDRKVYLELKKHLELIGGKWKSGKTQGFVFENDPTVLLEHVTEAAKEGVDLKKKFQFFHTPREAADRLLQLAVPMPHEDVLEPSAGQGHLVDLINDWGITPDVFELMPTNKEILLNRGFSLNFIGDDFLKAKPTKLYDTIIANPPFSNNQDIDHVRHMHKFLKPEGALFSIMSQSWIKGTQKKQVAFREWLEENLGEVVYTYPRGSFAEAGTMIEPVVVRVNGSDTNTPLEQTPKEQKPIAATTPEPVMLTLF